MSRFNLLVICIISNFLNINGSLALIISPPRLLDPPTNGTIGKRISANLYFEQKIDHFKPTDLRTYNQRYHVNDEYYLDSDAKNHIFLMLGGEWEATTSWLTYGSWLESAEQYGALLIYLEHRFYGLSQPFEDWSTENLEYLSSHQALADAATFIEFINVDYNITDPKWIVFGGSYSATLATWLRYKYPHLVTGAVASSGPLEAVLDFHEYLEVVGNGMKRYSQSCVDNIKEAFAGLDELSTSCLEDPEVYKDIDEGFLLCDSLESSEGNDEDLMNLFETIIDDDFAYLVQYHGRLSISIDDICEILVNDTADNSTALKRLAQAHVFMLNSSNTECTDYKYENLLADWRNTTIDRSLIMRQWFYQTCTEFGFFQTTNQEDPVFGSRVDVTFFTDLCVQIFGAYFNSSFTSQAIETTNTIFGGRNITISNVIHFHGLVDPWHALGRLSTSEEVGDTVILVEDVAHCASMYTQKETDPEALNEARTKIHELIGQWLGYNNGQPSIVYVNVFLLFTAILYNILM
ncbi:hypothetical protein ABEB36_004948 [Hypothenemus hampei]|uniref:Serine protease K12H4.7 n=1 Tax=Hypothenemus hampei TaxID=57062 RepID=A0ABD1F0B1_HYPHA